MQKKIKERPTNKMGVSSQPKSSRVVRKMISTGIVTMSKVNMTILSLKGGGAVNVGRLGDERAPEAERAAACNEVEILDTKMEPTLPGRPGEVVI